MERPQYAPTTGLWPMIWLSWKQQQLFVLTYDFILALIFFHLHFACFVVLNLLSKDGGRGREDPGFGKGREQIKYLLYL